MHIHDLENLQHRHEFFRVCEHCERRTWWVIILTAVMMVVEVCAGLLYGSMALLADGWHMGTHVAALSITVFAYWYARRYADDPAYSFGTGKVSVLGGFASAVVLAVVALLMMVESVERLLSPTTIQFNEAMLVAAIGLVVNLVSAYMLHGGNDHGHDHGHQHHGHGEGGHHHHDHNIRAAYMHVLADALTSVLAIVALFTGKMFGWIWMDPLMGIVGGLIIVKWSYGLLRDTSRVLLDAGIDEEIEKAVRETIESDADNRISDMHVWQVSPSQWAAIVSIATHHPRSAEHYKNLLADFSELAHVTVEVKWYEGESCVK